MPEVLDKPETKPLDQTPVWAQGMYEPEDVVDTDTLPEQVADTPPPEAKPEAEKPNPATVAELPPQAPELVEKAVRFGLTSDEIKALGPALEGVVKRMDSFGQTVWDLASKQQPRQEQAKPEDDFIPFSYGKDEEGNEIKEADLSPGIVNALKDISKNAKLEVRKMRDELEQKSAMSAVAQRIEVMASKAGVSQILDRSTAAGSQKYAETLAMMHSIGSSMKQIGRDLSEQQVFDMAIKALDVAPPKPKEEVKALEEKKEKWDKGALASGESREGEDTPEKRVRKLLQKYRQENAEKPPEESPFQD